MRKTTGFTRTGFTYPARRSGEAGLSLIELMIAMLMFSFIAIGILPMLMRSLADTNQGWEATEVSNLGQSTLEPALAADFESTPLTIGAALTERTTIDYWVNGDRRQIGDAGEGWTTAASPNADWTRNTFVRQYDVGNLNAPISGDTDPTEVHVKEVQVHLFREGTRSGGEIVRAGNLGVYQDLWIRVFKAY